MSPREVQHISGQGPRYAVEHGLYDADYWIVMRPSPQYTLHLPKADYVLVEAEPVWRDVSAEIEYRKGTWLSAGLFHHGKPINGSTYRLRKVQGTIWKSETEPNPVGWCFIVEKLDP